MISLYTIFTFAFIHWVFDFWLQTDEQAKGKSHSNVWLRKHVGVYTLGITLMAVMNFMFFQSYLGCLTWVALNSILHFFTDYVSSRASSLLFKEENYHDAFVVIGADQMIHTFTLFGTFIYITAQ